MNDVKSSKKKKEEELVEEVQADFKRRQEERRSLERSWQLNLNYLNGNQYCDINLLGEIEEGNDGFYWQEKKVFNYIAPTVENRCCKLTGIRPQLTVRAASDDDDDKRSAKLSAQILSTVFEDCDMDALLTAATNWSEACGTVFYKVIWDSLAGNEIGKTFDGASVREGNVKVIVVSPFEIYPDSLTEENIANQRSIIHARAVPADDIYTAYGVKVEGRDVYDYVQPYSKDRPVKAGGDGRSVASSKHGYEVVIERYVRPNSQFPNGRLTIVAADKLLYDGDLPYINGEGGTRSYPFAVQYSLPHVGSFFGDSVVQRLIPVQRAYNAVKNRKHEFLNRIAMGVMTVEDGSLDTDELLEDGLMPGKILVYRQGGNPPEMLTLGSVPAEFDTEEKRLEEEFENISGTGEISQKVGTFSGVTSATGLQIIIEQNEKRLKVSYEQIKSALRAIGKMTLRLYRQFVSTFRLMNMFTGGDTLMPVSFKGSDITGDNVAFEAENDLSMTPARRRSAIYEMIDKGLFSDENGKISAPVKEKLLYALGYNGFIGGRDLNELHRRRAAEENEALVKGGEVAVKDYDEHLAHIAEHTAFLLTEKLSKEQEMRICAHLNLHKNLLSEVKDEANT